MAKHNVLHTFYSSQKWVNFRLKLINDRGNTCERCKEFIARSIDIIGHHTIELTPENVHDYMISLNPELVELICFDCHNEEHQRFGYENKKRVFLVYGPPMSGKTTLVKHRMKRGDLIIDLDLLSAAISFLPQYDKPDNLFSNVMGVHNQLIDNVKTRMGKWHNAWVVGGYADKFKRERMANMLGAELIFCNVAREVCIANLEQDEGRRYRKHEWTQYINKWFEQYRE